MQFGSEYVAYLMLFRLAIISSGTVAMILGYRLFAMAMIPAKDSQHTSVSAKITGASFSIRNAAPGTAFCGFGMFLIVAMLVQGTPELSYKRLKGDKGQDAAETLRMRGLNSTGQSLSTADERTPTTFSEFVAAGKHAEQTGNQDGATQAFKKALAQISLPMNDLAILYGRHNKVDKALSLAKMATQISPEDGDLFDTLADLQEQNGDHAQAIKSMQRAVALSPSDSKLRGKLAALQHEHP